MPGMHSCLIAFTLVIQGQATKKTELPEVSLEIPKETRPEIRAILVRAAADLRSSDPKVRLRGAAMVGELKEDAKPIRQILCRRMIDPVQSVRIAAADALKMIDPQLQNLALELTLVQSAPTNGTRLLQEIARLGETAEPLVPLVMALSDTAALHASAARGNNRAANYEESAQAFMASLSTLSQIAPSDPVVYRRVFGGLDNLEPAVRSVAIQGIARMKHRANAVPKLITMLKTDPRNRVLLIAVLAEQADASNEDSILASIHSYRYDENRDVREAVEKGVNKIKAKP